MKENKVKKKELLQRHDPKVGGFVEAWRGGVVTRPAAVFLHY